MCKVIITTIDCTGFEWTLWWPHHENCKPKEWTARDNPADTKCLCSDLKRSHCYKPLALSCVKVSTCPRLPLAHCLLQSWWWRDGYIYSQFHIYSHWLSHSKQLVQCFGSCNASFPVSSVTLHLQMLLCVTLDHLKRKRNSTCKMTREMQAK